MGFHGMPVQICPDCGQRNGVEGNGIADTLRHLYSTHAHPGAQAGNLYGLEQLCKHP